MKFNTDGKGNVFTKCDFSGISINRIYQVPKQGSNTERFGCFMDPACAVAFYTAKHREKKLEAIKLAEYLASIALDLHLQPSQFLVEAPALDAVNPDLSYRKKHPWMICDDLLISAATLKQRIDDEKKEKAPPVVVANDSSSEDTPKKPAEKNIYIYSLDPNSSETTCSKPHLAVKADGFVLDCFSRELFFIQTTYKSKDVLLVGCQQSVDKNGNELTFNSHVNNLFNTNVKTSLYGPAFIISKRVLGQPIDEENEAELTLFVDQKKNRKPNNFKTQQSESIVNKYLAERNIVKEEKTKKNEQQQKKGGSDSSPPSQSKENQSHNKRRRTD